MTDSTRETIVKCQQGDLTAFNELVRGHQSYAFALALRLLHNIADAEDVTQDAFVRVWQMLDRIDPNRKFSTWLYRIVLNLCLDKLRAQKRAWRLFSSINTLQEGMEPASNEDVAQSQSNSQLCQIIKTMTRDLSTTQRVVFTLRDLEDLPIEEVCAITGLSEGSVKTNLHYARKKVRAILTTTYNVTGLM